MADKKEHLIFRRMNGEWRQVAKVMALNSTYAIEEHYNKAFHVVHYGHESDIETTECDYYVKTKKINLQPNIDFYRIDKDRDYLLADKVAHREYYKAILEGRIKPPKLKKKKVEAAPTVDETGQARLLL